MLKSESQNKNFEEYLKLEFVLSNLIKYRFMLSILQQDGGLLPPPISSSYSPPLVWLWGGVCDIWDWDWRWTFDLYTLYWCWKVVGWWVMSDYNVSSGPFLSFEIETWQLEMDQDLGLTVQMILLLLFSIFWDICVEYNKVS